MNEKIKTITDNFKLQIHKYYQNRLSNLILFGSQARKDAADGSDIDIMIVLNDKEVDPAEELKETIEIIAALSLQFDEVISCVFISKERFINEKSPLLINVRKEGIII